MIRIILAWACVCVLGAPAAWATGEGKRGTPRTPAPSTPGKIAPVPAPIPNLNIPLAPGVIPGAVQGVSPAALGANAIPKGGEDRASPAISLPLAAAPVAAPAAAPAAKPPAAAVNAKEQLKQASSAAPAAPVVGGGESDKDAADRAFEYAAPRPEGEPTVSIAGTGTTWTGTGAPRLSPAPTRGPPAAAAATLEAVLDRAVERRDIPEGDREQWLKAVYIDPLTGVYNRQYLDDHKGTLTKTNSVLLDIKHDDLKEVNDSYDHERGNVILRSGAGVTATVIGREGVVIRRSPTSFQVFLDASEEDAYLAAQALRAVVERTMGNAATLLPGPPNVEPAAPLRGTISVGVGAMTGDSASPARYDGGLERVRQARAVAKESGGGNSVAVDALIAQALGDAAKDSRAATKEELERALDDRSLTRMAAVKATDAAAQDSRVMDRMELEEAVAALKKGKKAAIGVQAQKAAASTPAEAVEVLRQAAAHRPVRELLERVQDPALRRDLFRRVYIDRLSGLKNRRWLFDHLPEVLGAEGFLHYISLDIDHFGEKNAMLGEERADLILKELGLMMSEATRGQDADALHPSGEEFVLLAGRRITDPRPFAEEFRQRVETDLGARVAKKHGIVDPGTGKPLTITVSMGIGRIRQDAAGLKTTLELADAAAEAMLKRAKARGRNRVEIGPGELAVAVARVFRLDTGLRRAIARLTERPQEGELFDNTMRPRRDAVRGLGFDPAVEPGRRIDPGDNAESQVWLITPRQGPPRAVKIAPQEMLDNELFARLTIAESPLLRAHVAAPAAFGYKRLWRRPVMVMEYVEPRKGGLDSRVVPIAHRGALTALHIGLGLAGMNPGAYLSVDWAGVTLSDFLNARLEEKPNWNPNRVGHMTDLGYVSAYHLNDLRDYRPALNTWKNDWPRLRGRVAAFLRRLGVPEATVQENLKTLNGNTRRMEEILKADIAYADGVFRESASRAGLDEKRTLSLSAINRDALSSPEGGIVRDLVRLFNGRLAQLLGPSGPAQVLSPAELKNLKDSRPAGLTPHDRRALRAALAEGRLRSPEGFAYGPAAAVASLKRLDLILKD